MNKELDDIFLSKYIPKEENRFHHICGVVEEMKLLLPNIIINDDIKKDLINACYLHDIGYSEKLIQHSFHPIDGALFSIKEAFSKPIISAVMFHSSAYEDVKNNYHSLIDIYNISFDALQGLDRLFIDLLI